jgi:hypothetical protein
MIAVAQSFPPLVAVVPQAVKLSVSSQNRTAER